MTGPNSPHYFLPKKAPKILQVFSGFAIFTRFSVASIGFCSTLVLYPPPWDIVSFLSFREMGIQCLNGVLSWTGHLSTKKRMFFGGYFTSIKTYQNNISSKLIHFFWVISDYVLRAPRNTALFTSLAPVHIRRTDSYVHLRTLILSNYPLWAFLLIQCYKEHTCYTDTGKSVSTKTHEHNALSGCCAVAGWNTGQEGHT